MSGPPENPFRVTRRGGFDGPPLTAPQQRVLAALAALCPDSGCDISAREVAEAADIRLGSVVVILRSLAKRRLAILHEGGDDAPEAWAPTISGRSRVRHFRTAEERPSAERPDA